MPTSLPPGFSREATPASVASDDDPLPKSGLRLPVDHTPQRRSPQPPISGPIYVPAKVFAVLTSPVAPLPSATDSSLPPASAPLFPTLAGHALRSLIPPAPKPIAPRPAHSLQNRVYVCVKISEKRRAELIARGVYDAFRDDEDAQFRALAPRKRNQHYAAGSNRVMVQNVPLVLARPEELPERFIERPGPALLEPYASVLKEDRLVNTLGDYVCGWKGCGAVLGSVDRLKRHVAKRAHAAESAVAAERTVYRCFWAGCEGPCFERVEGLIQHLSARHVAGRLRCPFEDCEMTSPTLAHLQRHAIRQHAPEAPLRPRADLPILPSLPSLPPLPGIAHADQLCTHRVNGRQHASAYRQEHVRARIQRLCFGGPEPDTEAGGVTMMEQLALTPQPDAPPQRKRKRMNWGWVPKKKYPSQVRVKTEPGSDAGPPLRIGVAERNWAAKQVAAQEKRERRRERYERKRLGRVWVEIPVKDKRKEGIYERPETPPPSPVTPGSAVDRRERMERKRARESEGRPEPDDAESSNIGRKRKTEFNTAVFDSFRSSVPAASVSASVRSERRPGATEDGDSEAEFELGVSLDPTPVSHTPSRSSYQLHSARSARSGSAVEKRTPNGHLVTPVGRGGASASSVTSTGKRIPRHSVEVVVPRQSPLVTQ